MKSLLKFAILVSMVLPPSAVWAGASGASPSPVQSPPVPATHTQNGLMSASDKVKLDGITAGAGIVSIGVTPPITTSGGSSPTIGISLGTGLHTTSGSATADLSLGVAGGQSVIGGINSGDKLSIFASTNATPGTIDAYVGTVYGQGFRFVRTDGLPEIEFKTYAGGSALGLQGNNMLSVPVLSVANIGNIDSFAEGSGATLSLIPAFEFLGQDAINIPAPANLNQDAVNEYEFSIHPASTQLAHVFGLFHDGGMQSFGVDNSGRIAISPNSQSGPNSPNALINLTITTGGATGTMAFEWATNGGTYSSPITSTAGTYVFVVPGTNCTLTLTGTFDVGNIWTITSGGVIAVAMGSNTLTSGSITQVSTSQLIQIDGPILAGLQASQEQLDLNFNLARNVQFATGALTTQRAVVFSAPTYSFVGASTLTKAATVAITGAPAAGTNATITNSYALWVQAGLTELDGGLKVGSGSMTVTSLVGPGNVTVNSAGLFAADTVTYVPTTRTVTGTGAIQIDGSNAAKDLSANRTWTIVTDSTLVGASSTLGRAAIAGDVTISGGSNTSTLGNIPNDTTGAGDILFTAIAAPSTPASGKARVYVDSTSLNFTVKNASGTVNHGVQTAAAVSHQFVTAISDAGGVSQAQPAYTDISGSIPAITSLTGDVTGTGPGATATTIANNAVTNAKFRQSANGTVVGNSSGGTANVSDQTVIEPLELTTNSLALHFDAASLVIVGGTTLERGALIGDVTASTGSNSTTIASNVVSYGKMQQGSAHVLIGNPTGGTANLSEITLGSGLSFSGTTLTASGSGGTLTAVTATAPVVSSGGATPNITLNIDSTLATVSSNLGRAAITGDVSISAGSNTSVLGNIPNATTAAGDINFTAIAAPATPASGHGLEYDDSTSLTLSFKNASGTVSHTAQTFTAASHQFATALADTGAWTTAQPSYSDISGSVPAITSLTGDGTASGPGSAAFTLATVATPGTYITPTIIVDGKGRITSASFTNTYQVVESDGSSVTSEAALNFVAPLHAADSGGSPFRTNATLLYDNASVTLNGSNQIRVTVPANQEIAISDGTKLIGIPSFFYDGNLLWMGTDLSQWPYIVESPTDGVDGGSIHLSSTNTVVAGTGSTLKSITLGGDVALINGTTNVTRLDQVFVNRSTLGGVTAGSTATTATSFAVQGCPTSGGVTHEVIETNCYALDVMAESTHLGGPLVQELGAVSTTGSGGAIVPTSSGNVTELTGTTSINTIQSTLYHDGSIIWLFFDSGLTVVHNTVGTYTPISLVGGVNATMPANSKMQLMLKAGSWWELSRSN